MKLKKFNELNEEIDYYGGFPDAKPVKRKYVKKIVVPKTVVEDSPNKPSEPDKEEYFLITFTESDETNFMLVPMKHFDAIKRINDKLSNSRLSVPDVDKMIEQIEKLKTEDFFMQTYCIEDWPFENYTIKKIISIPELGN